MALLYQAWEADGKNGEAEIGSFRSDSRHVDMANLPQYLQSWKDWGNCVRITKARTEVGSVINDVWLRPGYKDPFLLPGEAEACVK